MDQLIQLVLAWAVGLGVWVVAAAIVDWHERWLERRRERLERELQQTQAELRVQLLQLTSELRHPTGAHRRGTSRRRTDSRTPPRAVNRCRFHNELFHRRKS
jgi:hypothetical protein